MFLIFDTETTGLPKRWNAPVSDSNNWPRCVQLAWQLHDETGKCLEYKNYLIKPNGFEIPFAAEKVHGISTELAQKKGTELKEVLDNFKNILSNTKYLCGHNIVFDINILSSEYYRYYNVDPLKNFPKIDTCNQETANICMLPGGKGVIINSQHLVNYISKFLVKILMKLTMLQLMLMLQQDVYLNY